MKRKMITLFLCVCLVVSMTTSALATQYGIVERRLETSEIISLYQDEVNKNRLHPIEIIDYRISNVNSVGGIDVQISWTNTSGKEIKYITFTAIPYNRVNDVQYSDVGNISKMKLKVTGPVSPAASTIDFASIFEKRTPKMWNTIGNFSYSEDNGIYWNGSQAYVYRSVYNSQTGEYDDVPYNVSAQDFMGGYFSNEMQYSEWETVWYNSTIDYFKITAIKIEYMDGTVENVNPAAVILDYAYTQKSR